jgi:hypothetical protein
METREAVPATADPEVAYSVASEHVIEMVHNRIGQIVRRPATERALEQGRTLIRSEDVVEFLAYALLESSERLIPTQPEHGSCGPATGPIGNSVARPARGCACINLDAGQKGDDGRREARR